MKLGIQIVFKLIGLILQLLFLGFVCFLFYWLFSSAFRFLNSDILDTVTKWTIIILASLSCLYIYVILKIETNKDNVKSKVVFKLIDKVITSIICLCLIILLIKLISNLLTPMIITTYNRPLNINTADISNENINIGYVIGSLYNFIASLITYLLKFLFLAFLIGLSYLYIPVAILKLLRKIFSFNSKSLNKIDDLLQRFF